MPPPFKLPLPARLAALAVAGGAAAATVGLLVRNREGLLRKLAELGQKGVGGRRREPLPQLDVQALVARVADALRASHPERSLTLAGGATYGHGDAAQLFEVFASLVGDALATGQPVTVTTREEGAWAVVAVHRPGEGAATVPGPVHDILAAHEGAAEVHAAPGTGSTVTVRVPSAPPAAQV
jgi:signal transduction histidine kinase